MATLQQRRDTLIASDGPRRQWLRDGVVLRGSTGRMLVADRSGRYQVRIENETGCQSLSEVRELRFGSATVTLPRLTARAGDTVDIPLRLVNPSGLDAAGAGAMTALVAVKKKTLHVIAGGTVESESDEEVTIRVDGRYEAGKATVAVLRAVVAPGRARVPLRFRRVEWKEGLVRGGSRDGMLQRQR
jgi:hypothetical protein